jgi:hypothetical protein
MFFRHKGLFPKISRIFKNRAFSTSEKTEIKNDYDLTVLNPYLKESVFSLGPRHLKNPEISIIESINKNTPSMILCDEYHGRKLSCMLGIMNRIINRGPEEYKSKNLTDSEYSASESETEEYFINTVDKFNKKQEMNKKNLEKKDRAPRGALIICQKFEFATYFYRMCRRFDFKNKLRMVRVGTSLHTVAPAIEFDVKYTIFNKI